MDNYHDKFDRLYEKRFTGRVFNNEEFLHHLENINFHHEGGVLSKVSEVVVGKVKNKFEFYKYGASIKGIEMDSETYTEDFEEMVMSIKS